jgi:hypothetical protein
LILIAETCAVKQFFVCVRPLAILSQLLKFIQSLTDHGTTNAQRIPDDDLLFGLLANHRSRFYSVSTNTALIRWDLLAAQTLENPS